MTRVLHQVFRGHAQRQGDHPALVEGTRVLTYAELDAASDRVAAGLRARGVGPGERVALLLPRSIGLVTAILGTLKCGASYSALDPGWPAVRVEELSRRLEPAAVIDAGAYPAVASARGARVDEDVDGDDIATVVFTSGTSGRPKGVLSPHRAIARLFPRCGAADLTGRPIVSLSTAVSWDGFALELWGALCSGGTAVVVTEPYPLPQRVRELVDRGGLDTLFLPASLLNLYVDEDLDAFTGLRQVMTGGERISAFHAGRFVNRHPDIALVNCYGPAECGILVTTHRVTAEDCARRDVPIGLPAPDTRIHLIDGEMFTGGDGLARGYLGDAAGTAERFVEIVVDDGDRTRAYRTGDRGERGQDGLLRYRGRLDRQVKIRGHRVEPAEIETAADALDGVVRSAAVPLTGSDGTTTGLALFYQGERPAPGVEGELRARLPGYLVPARITRVDGFPLTANGKTDHEALTAPLLAGPAKPAATGETSVDPDPLLADPVTADPVTEVVAEGFAHVLGLPEVQVTENFFALGGTSLAAGRLCVRLGARLGVTVPVSAVMRHPTAARLAAWLRTRGAGEDRGEPGTPTAATAVPLLPSQLGFFLAAQMRPEDVSGMCPLVWEYEGTLERAALQAALTDVAIRHEALRSRYFLQDGPVAKIAAEPYPVELRLVEDPHDLPAVLIRPLDLESGQVWRSALAPGRFGIVVHHIAIDGWAAGLLAHDLSVAYRARLDGRAPRFGGPAPGLGEVARAYHRQAGVTDLDAQRAYWRHALTGLPDPGRRDGVEPGRLASVSRPLAVTRLDESALRHRTTSTVVLLAAYARAVEALTGGSDLAVGVPVARRNDDVLARSVTCLIDMVCVRLRGAGVAAAKAGLVDALSHQDVPAYEVARLARRRPLYTTVLAVQDAPEPRLDLPAATRFVWADTTRLDVDLVVEFLPGSVLRVSHRCEAVPADVAAALCDAIVRAVEEP
ncbi:AMP-binding protein [Nonomuraea sp. NPDC003754]